MNLNGDTFLDLAVAASGSTVVSVRTGDGKGAFSGTLNLNTGGNPGQVVIGDFTGDGKLDILVNSQTAGNVGLFAGNGNATFGAIANTVVGSSSIGLAGMDLDLDGKLDFVTGNANNNVIFLPANRGYFKGLSRTLQRSQRWACWSPFRWISRRYRSAQRTERVQAWSTHVVA